MLPFNDNYQLIKEYIVLKIRVIYEEIPKTKPQHGDIGVDIQG